jgi:probable HAF family extracellular repeat protein
MRGTTQMMGRALLGALVVAWIATTGWSQSLTWLGVRRAAGARLRVFPPTAPWWSARLATPQGRIVPFAGRLLAGCKTSARCRAAWSSRANGVSADGAVVVGWSLNAASPPRAFRWTASGGMQDLGTLPGGSSSQANGVSADGAVVVGLAHNAASAPRAFRWTAAGGMQDLGTLPGYDYSWANGVSADGSVVVGSSGEHAFRWTASGGMEDLNTTYASLLTNGSVLRYGTRHLPRWTLYCGVGRNAATGREEAFLLDTRCPRAAAMWTRNGCVDDADLLARAVRVWQGAAWATKT